MSFAFWKEHYVVLSNEDGCIDGWTGEGWLDDEKENCPGSHHLNIPY